jgi:streptomycin 6-kinase
VLKLSPDSRELAREVRSLQAFAAVGVAPAVVDVDAERGAVLMERLLPGHSLRDERPLLDRSQRKLEQLFWQLRDSRIRAPKDAITVQHHLSALLAAPLKRTGRAAAPAIPEQRRREAAQLLDRLVASGPQQLIHGDLHPGNVLLHSGRLMVVDAGGMVGDPAYDVAELILKYSSELQRSRHDPAVADRDLRTAAEWAGDAPGRVTAWAEVIFCAGA